MPLALGYRRREYNPSLIEFAVPGFDCDGFLGTASGGSKESKKLAKVRAGIFQHRLELVIAQNHFSSPLRRAIKHLLAMNEFLINEILQATARDTTVIVGGKANPLNLRTTQHRITVEV